MSDKNFDPGMEDTCELKEAWADGKKLYYVEDIPGLLKQIACLNKQLAEANVCVAEVETRKEALEESLNGCTEKVLSLSGKLAKANERVKELESELLMLTLATGRESTWALGEKLLNKFAIEKKIEALSKFKTISGAVANHWCDKEQKGYLWLHSEILAEIEKLEQLRKEQEHG